MGRSIQEMYDNFKRLILSDTFFYGMVIILVGILCFGLGRWSVVENMAIDKAITHTVKETALEATVVEAGVQASEVVEAVAPPTNTSSQLVGSRNGTKYHLLWCPGAKQIKEENKVYFDSKEEAVKAGYSPASNCKGL